MKNLLTAVAGNEQVSQHLDVELQKDFSLSFLVLGGVDQQVPHMDMHEQAWSKSKMWAGKPFDRFFFFC